MWISRKRWEAILKDIAECKYGYSELHKDIHGYESPYTLHLYPGLKGHIAAIERHLALGSPELVSSTPSYWMMSKLPPLKTGGHTK